MRQQLGGLPMENAVQYFFPLDPGKLLENSNIMFVRAPGARNVNDINILGGSPERF